VPNVSTITPVGEVIPDSRAGASEDIIVLVTKAVPVAAERSLLKISCMVDDCDPELSSDVLTVHESAKVASEPSAPCSAVNVEQEYQRSSLQP